MSLASTDRYSDLTLPLWREVFAGLEWMSLRIAPVFHGHGVERGQGEAVVLVPGLFAADASMTELSGWLARMGFRPYASGIGVNAVSSETAIAHVVATIDRAYAETGALVRLVGHSLGGVIARGAALRRSDRVTQIVTLGSPVQGLSAHPAVLALGQMIHGDDIESCMRALQQPLPVHIAETNVYSKDDGVVDWRTCSRGDATAVEVRGTHTGLIVNAGAYRAIGASLAETSARESTRRIVARATAGREALPIAVRQASKLAA